VEEALRLRAEVFCEEQGVASEAEFDGLDADATHIVVFDGERVVGTCRLLFEDDLCRLGRMAVRAEHRRSGIGGRIIAAAEHEAREGGAREIVLHAQRRAEAFYAAVGFVAEGGTFEEERIPHVLMRKPLGGGAV
jgi:predicted GNAT family N-acyltransferase